MSKRLAKKVYQRIFPAIPTACLAPARYVIISGCPRSGTSACLQWMNNHPKTVTFYETRMPYAVSGFCDAIDRYKKLDDRGDALRSELRKLFLRDAAFEKPTWRKTFVMKEAVQATAFETVDQFRMLQNLRSVLSPLTIVLMVRHPVNVVNSMLNRTWGGSIAGMEPVNLTLERGVNAWKNSAAMSIAFADDENVMSVLFEDFVRDPSGTASTVARKVGLDGTFNVNVKQTANVSLSDDQVEYIMKETVVEREFFGYGDQL